MGFGKAIGWLLFLGALSYTGFRLGAEYSTHRSELEYKRARSEYVESLREIGHNEDNQLGVLMNIISMDGQGPDTGVLEESVRAIARIGTQEAKMALHDILVRKSGDQVYGIVDRTATEELYKLDPEIAVDAIIGARGWANQQMNILIEHGGERPLLYLIESDKYAELKKFVERNGTQSYIGHKWPMIGVFERHMRGGYPETHNYFCVVSTLEGYGRLIAAFDSNYVVQNVVPKISVSCDNEISAEKIEQLVQNLF